MFIQIATHAPASRTPPGRMHSSAVCYQRSGLAGARLLLLLLTGGRGLLMRAEGQMPRRQLMAGSHRACRDGPTI